jgi:hypothetical protein
MANRPPSKKFKLYIYQGEKGGGNICECNNDWTGTGLQLKFNDKKEALNHIKKLLNDYCKK